METSTTRSKDLRSMFTRFGKIATASAFVVLICAFAIGPVQADEHHGGDHGRGGDQHRDDHDRGHRGPDVDYAPQPDYYYAPQPDYYAAPEPHEYYPSQPEYYPPPPSEGITLFFRL
jgi:hypothetical protein